MRPLLERATAANELAAARPLLAAAQQELEQGRPDDVRAQAQLWHRLAVERLRWRAAGCDDLTSLFSACRQACAAAENAEDWQLARTVAGMVRERLDPALPFVEGTRMTALRLEREACQRLDDYAGEATAVRAMLDADNEMPGLGEPWSAQRERTRRRLELCRAWRELLPDEARREVDVRELELLSGEPLPERMACLEQAWDRIVRQGPYKGFADERDEVLEEIRTADPADLADPAVRALAIRLWARQRDRCRARVADLATQAAKLRADAAIDLERVERTLAQLAGAPLPAAMPQSWRTLADGLPEPVTDESAADALISLALAGAEVAPADPVWLAWAQRYYRARPDGFVLLAVSEIDQPGTGAGIEWQRWAERAPAQRVACLRLAATVWADVAARLGDWTLRLRAEDCWRNAGDEPPEPRLPRLDPAAPASQGPDAAALDARCAALAAVPVGHDPTPALRDLLALVHCRGGALPPPPRQSHNYNRPYTGEVVGLARAARVWVLGERALDDLAATCRTHRLTPLIEIIAALGGTRSPAIIADLAEVAADPVQLPALLPALQRTVPQLLPPLLARVLPILPSDELSFLAYRGSDCLDGEARNLVAAEVLDRSVGVLLVRAVLAWQAQEPSRLQLDRLWRVWHRFGLADGIDADLTAAIGLCRDPRADGWLVAMATRGPNDSVRATAINALAARGEPAVAGICRRELAWTTDQLLSQAAALLAAAGAGLDTAPTVTAWLEQRRDDPEDPLVRAARCLRLARDGAPADLAWAKAAAALPRRYLSIALVHDLGRTRLPGAIAPAGELLPLAIAGIGRPADARVRLRLACSLSLLPADAAVRAGWAAQLGRPIPDVPLTEPLGADEFWGSEP
jgi:hypothetical protein